MDNRKETKKWKLWWLVSEGQNVCRTRLCKSVGDVVWNKFSKVGKKQDNVYDLKHRELTALSGDDREEDLIISHREDIADQYVACGVGTTAVFPERS